MSIFTLLPYYILAPTISLRKCPFSCYNLIMQKFRWFGHCGLRKEDAKFWDIAKSGSFQMAIAQNLINKTKFFKVVSIRTCQKLKKCIFKISKKCFYNPFFAKNTFFHLMLSPKFLNILQRIGLNHGNAHVKLFQWYIFGLGAIGKSLSLIRPIFHFFTHPFLG